MPENSLTTGMLFNEAIKSMPLMKSLLGLCSLERDTHCVPLSNDKPKPKSSAGLASSACPRSRLRVLLPRPFLSSFSRPLGDTCDLEAESIAFFRPSPESSADGTSSPRLVFVWWRLCWETFYYQPKPSHFRRRLLPCPLSNG